MMGFMYVTNAEHEYKQASNAVKDVINISAYYVNIYI